MAPETEEDSLDDLLARYEDDASAVWTWSAALVAFRRTGDTAKSRV